MMLNEAIRTLELLEENTTTSIHQLHYSPKSGEFDAVGPETIVTTYE